jgi:putative protease
VLARELSVDEIAEIHRLVPDVELEVFVHGALCVSYSGLCYVSQHCFQRSANRGECAQFCRMKFDLVDADGRVVERQRHLLSLKDLNQSDHLEELIEAGAVSFKIEGRLKGVDYVKNVTAYYSERLNAIIARHPDKYQRASLGHCRYTFTPSLAKTFNRGYTNYFLHGRTAGIASFDTPKAMGEFVGTVKELRPHSLSVAGIARFANGDGLCFLNADHELEGFRVNRVEGNRLYPLKMPASLRPGMRLYRNQDQEFERLLTKPSAERKVPVRMRLDATADGFALQINDAAPVSIVAPHQQAQKPQHDNIVRQLTKLGGTPLSCSHVELPDGFCYFIPSSQLAELRRMAVASFCSSRPAPLPAPPPAEASAPVPTPVYATPYLYNIANSDSRRFYAARGVASPQPAFELQQPRGSQLLMQCRHCLRFALGFCVKHGGRKPEWREPLSLVLADGRRFPLEFDCQHCQMNVYAESR